MKKVFLKERQKTEVYHPDTHLCVALKTMLRHDRRMQAGKSYRGVLKRDVVCEEYYYDDDHFTFVEDAGQTYRRNPRVYDGKYVSITQREDGSLRPNLKQVMIDDGFDIIGYVTEVGNELMWGLEGLRRK